MNPPDHTPDTPSRRQPRLGWWLLLWLPAAGLAMGLSVLLAAWVWAGSASSLGRTLGWAQTWLEDQPPQVGRLEVQDADGSLRRGGRIGLLRWEQDGLHVSAHGVRLAWTDEQVLGLPTRRRLDIDGLHIERLEIRDDRPATDGGPPASLELPLLLSLPWSVDLLVLQGEEELRLEALRGLYTHDAALDDLGVPQAHRLRLDNLRWAAGEYQGELLLGAQAPMPLRLNATGRVQVDVPDGLPQVLDASLQARGHLAGIGAAIDLQLALTQVGTPAEKPPALDARARIRPWDTRQVLEQLDARVHELNLAGLWPDAPLTALSGEAQASPREQGWQARVALGNALPAPLDRQGLPFDQLRLELIHEASRWTLPGFEARLGAGRLHGNASLTAENSVPWQGPWSGQVQIERVDPARLWNGLAPGQLDGELLARAEQAGADAFAATFSGRLRNTAPTALRRAAQALPVDELVLQGRWQAPVNAPARGQLQLDQLALRAFGLQLDGQGRLDLSTHELQGDVKARAPGWSGSWSGLADAARGQGQIRLDLTDADASLAWLRSLQTAPWVGRTLTETLEGLRGLDVQGQGSLGVGWRGGLAPLGYPPASTTASPSPQALTIDAVLQLPRLQVRDSSSAPIWEIEDTRLRFAGPPSALKMELQARAQGEPGRFSVNTTGQLTSAWPAGSLRIQTPPTSGHWRLDTLTLRARAPGQSPVNWRLDSHEALDINWEQRNDGVRVSTGPVQLRLQAQPGGNGQSGGGTVRLGWDQLDWDRGALSTRGRIDDLPVAWVDLLTAADEATQGLLGQAGIRSDLLLQGRWDLQLPAGSQTLPQVQLQLERQSGDLSIRTDGLPSAAGPLPDTVTAGVRTARLALSTEGRAVQARLLWDTERLGEIDAQLRTELSPPDATRPAWYWAERAPLAGLLRARLPEVGVWSALAPPGWRVQGTLEAEADISGDRQQPQWRGQLRADNLAVRSVVEGIAFTDGSLRATLDGDRLRVERLVLNGPGQAGDGGVLEASGQAEWRAVQREGRTRQEPLIELQATARQLRVSNRPDRRLTLSGQMQARLEGTLLDIRGRLAADSALFLLPDELTPTLGPDVVVRGRGTPPPPGNGARVQTSVNVDIDLGPRFEVRGQGLSTRLGGQLTVRSTPALPALRVLGEVRTQSGTYRAYGQQLSIESGVLRFAGPYDDPGLDIVAIRPNLRQQRVGVQILGTALRPQVRLFSDPDMPDSEKLAWLVLGRPATGAGAEAAVLQQAALALLAGDGEGVGSRLAGFLGLDQLELVDRGENGDALSLGKRFSNRLYLNYERGLLSTLGTVSVFYEISRWLSLRARAGEENAVDVIFLREFD